MQSMTATEFKATCLDVLDRVNSGEIEELAITKRGTVVAVLHRPKVTLAEARALFGCMKGTLGIPDDLDLTAPVCDPEEWDAERGVLFNE